MKPMVYAQPIGELAQGELAQSCATRELALDDGNCRLPATQQLQRWLLQYGSQSSAYFNLQSNVRHFAVDGVGFLSYFPQFTPFGMVNIVYTNPVCQPACINLLLQAYFRAQNRRTLFIGVDERVARALGDFGYRRNQMGREHSIQLNRFDLAGKCKKQLRHAANLGERHGIVVREQLWQAVDLHAVQSLSNAWRSEKAVHRHELRLLTRPPVFGDEWQVRKFYAYQAGKLLGYVYFDPYFQQGQVLGYCANILRSWPGVRPSGVLDYIMLHAIQQFQREGIQQVSLGIAPLYKVEACQHDRPSVRRVQQWLYQHANGLYAFQALAYHKSRYRGAETPWYLCSDDIGLLKMSWSLLFGTGLLGR